MALLGKDVTTTVDSEMFCFDAHCHSDLLTGTLWDANQSNQTDFVKKYFVYLELPKVRIGDYRKSSCISGDVLRFHFLLKIAQDEAATVLRLLPIKQYQVPVVNFAVMHRTLLEDEDYIGPIPKSPNVKSPLIRYDDQEVNEAITEEIAEDFRSSQQQQQHLVEEQEAEKEKVRVQMGRAQNFDSATPDDDGDLDGELESYGLRQPPLQSDDHSARSARQKRPKKYFVYCEIPKVLIGDYRNSSVVCSDIIHAHFLMKIARNEEVGQPQLRPIRRYHRPRVNFAVIHRSLLVDDEATGPIPHSRGVRSPMIKEDEEEEENQDEGTVSHERIEPVKLDRPFPMAGASGMESSSESEEDQVVMHATMGFCYGRLPRSKYELISQWSLVASDSSGITCPELVLSKAEA